MTKRKKRAKRQTSDDRRRVVDDLQPEPEHGCQIYRKKLLCSKPTFAIVANVSLCIECWERVMDIAADGHLDTKELRQRYERIATQPPRPRIRRAS